MDTLTVITLAALAACGSTQYYGYPGVLNHGLHYGYSGLLHGAAPHLAHHRYAAPYAPILAKYHSQDALGQYSFGYTGGLSNRAETRDAYGNVRGSYTYIDSNGLPQTQHYVADALGFRVSGTNLPVGPANPDVPALAGPEPVTDTPEVAAAKAEFQALYDEAAAAAAAAPGERKKRQAPEPVEDTPEVAQAKAEFQAAYEIAAAAAEAAPDKGPLEDYAPVYHHHGYTGLHHGYSPYLGLHHGYTGLRHGYSRLHHGFHGHHLRHSYVHHPHGFSYSHGYALPTSVHVY